ncbi:uncharacterized protein LOC6617886 [Drosophila sechellia]|uniref:GM10608 n=1 Tax=Drosophila sechellia TaxID=7238 RepID=B4IEN4_DROSE|nr:uncharacterized protein LOC6617886 [Drosophila sechellia]EDW46061.1 GM10608 [Drosophila sechellia]
METLFSLYCFLILNCVDSTQRNFRIVVDRISTKIFDTNTIETLGCQVDQSNNCSFVNCHMLLNLQVNKLDARNVLDFVKPNGQEMKLYDGRSDACILLKKNRLVNIYSKSFKRFSNLKCPLKANFNYTMKNLYMDEQDFPSFVPYGTFQSIAQFDLNQTFIASRVIASGKVIPRL